MRARKRKNALMARTKAFGCGASGGGGGGGVSLVRSGGVQPVVFVIASSYRTIASVELRNINSLNLFVGNLGSEEQSINVIPACGAKVMNVCVVKRYTRSPAEKMLGATVMVDVVLAL
jgi:hypothetical protein